MYNWNPRGKIGRNRKKMEEIIARFFSKSEKIVNPQLQECKQVLSTRNKKKNTSRPIIIKFHNIIKGTKMEMVADFSLKRMPVRIQ